jgi:hypothetical protein
MEGDPIEISETETPSQGSSLGHGMRQWLEVLQSLRSFERICLSWCIQHLIDSTQQPGKIQDPLQYGLTLRDDAVVAKLLQTLYEQDPWRLEEVLRLRFKQLLGVFLVYRTYHEPPPKLDGSPIMVRPEGLSVATARLTVPYGNGVVITETAQLNRTQAAYNLSQSSVRIKWHQSYFRHYTISSDASDQVYPIRGYGPGWRWRMFKSCALDCAIVAAQYLAIGASEIDIGDFQPSQLQPKATLLFIETLNLNFSCMSPLHQAPILDSLMDQIVTQLQPSMAGELNFTRLWSMLLPMSSQLRFCRRIVSLCVDHSDHVQERRPFIWPSEVIEVSKGHHTIQQGIQAAFAPKTMRKSCSTCAGVLQKRVRVGCVPLRFQVECHEDAGELEPGPFLLPMMMYDYRHFWIDSELNQPLRLRVYDGLHPQDDGAGMVIGGVLPEGSRFFSQHPWKPAHLFFERIDCLR